IDYMLVDTPAGLDADDLGKMLAKGDRVIVPVLPSVLDLDATERFLGELAALPAVAAGRVDVGLVLNRIRNDTVSARTALERLSAQPFPVLAQIRDTQAYLLSAAMGKGLFDYHSQIAQERQQDYRKLLRWLA